SVDPLPSGSRPCRPPPARRHAHRRGGVLASRASTWPRDHFCRSTMAPRLSRPMTWKEFLPISMPATAIAVLSFEDIACSLSLAPLASVTCWRGRSTAGPFHYPTCATRMNQDPPRPRQLWYLLSCFGGPRLRYGCERYQLSL